MHSITSIDWRTYPILHFRDAPIFEPVLLNQPGQPYRGTGKKIYGPVPVAIANALFDAVDVRLRCLLRWCVSRR